MRDLTLSIIQDELDWQDSVANRERFSRHIRSLSAASPDLIVLPEMFNTGFCMHPEGIDETMQGPTVTWMREQALGSGAVLTGSLIIKDAGGYKSRKMVVPSRLAIEQAYQHYPNHERLERLQREDETKAKWLTRCFFVFEHALRPAF